MVKSFFVEQSCKYVSLNDMNFCDFLRPAV